MPDAVTTISSPRSLSAVSAKAGAAIASVSKDMVANFNMERPRTPATTAEPADPHARSTDTGGASGVMPATPAPSRLHRMVDAPRNPPSPRLSLGLGIAAPTPAGPKQESRRAG